MTGGLESIKETRGRFAKERMVKRYGTPKRVSTAYETRFYRQIGQLLAMMESISLARQQLRVARERLDAATSLSYAEYEIAERAWYEKQERLWTLLDQLDNGELYQTVLAYEALGDGGNDDDGG